MKKNNKKDLIVILRQRFIGNMERHPDLSWKDVEKRLLLSGKALESLKWMEDTGGEPDVIGVNPGSGEYIFADCCKELPEGRKRLCYDEKARESCQNRTLTTSALEEAAKAGVCLMMEEEYLKLQATGEYDLTGQCWLATPLAVRQKEEAFYAECKFGKVFIYHDRADLSLADRGFRTLIYI